MRTAARAALTLVTLAAGCGEEQPVRNGDDCYYWPRPAWCPSFDHVAASSSATGGGPPANTMEPPPGWHRWPHAPADCAIFAPDYLDVVDPVVWEPCPFMPDGCEVATATWAQASGWGFGATDFVTLGARSTHWVVGRVLGEAFQDLGWRWNEWHHYVDGELHAVLGADARTGASQCHASIHLSEGQIVQRITRTLALSSPWFYAEPVDAAFDDDPGQLFVFAGDLYSGGEVYRTGDWMIFGEWSPSNKYVARHVVAGWQCRVGPPDTEKYLTLLDAHQGAPHYMGWTGSLQSAWVHPQPCVPAFPLLKDSTYSYEHLASDGVDYAWVRAGGYQGQVGKFDTFELFTAPFVVDPEALQPRKVADLTLPAVLSDLLVVGEGYAAVRYTGGQDVRLFRLSDGAELQLPIVPDVAYAPGQTGLHIAGGEVWVAAFPLGGAGNDVRWHYRYRIDALGPPGG